MKKTLGCILVFCLFVAVMPAQAWFGRKGGDAKAGEEKSKNESRQESPSTNATRRYHLLIPDKATENELLDLFARKRVVRDDQFVLRRLMEEKRREFGRFDGELASTFAIRSDRNYHYNSESKTLYELIKDEDDKKTAPEIKGLPEGYSGQLHKQLKDDEEEKLFTALWTGRKMAFDALRVFQLVVMEKQREMDRLDDVLSEKFSLSRDRDYQYDAKTMRLFEIIPAAQKGEVKSDER